MLQQSGFISTQNGQLISTKELLQQDLTVQMGANNIVLQSSLGANLMRINMSGSELQYQTYNSGTSSWSTGGSIAPAFGQGFLEIYSTSTPVAASGLSGFVSQQVRGSGITFSQANQQVTLAAGNYIIQGYSDLTFTGTGGEFTWYPHNIAVATANRLGSPAEMHSWSAYPGTSTVQKNSSVVPINLTVGSTTTIDFRADVATNVSSCQYIAVTITRVA